MQAKPSSFRKMNRVCEPYRCGLSAAAVESAGDQIMCGEGLTKDGTVTLQPSRSNRKILRGDCAGLAWYLPTLSEEHRFTGFRKRKIQGDKEYSYEVENDFEKKDA